MRRHIVMGAVVLCLGSAVHAAGRSEGKSAARGKWICRI